MGHDYCRRVVTKRGPCDFTRIDLGAVEGAEKQDLKRKQPVTVVEKEDPENLSLKMANLSRAKLTCDSGISHRSTSL